MNNRQAQASAQAKLYSGVSLVGQWPLKIDERLYVPIGWAFLAFFALLNAFYGISNLGIINGNESLYVESAREMLLSGNYAIPSLNGVPYLEKPPLFVWLLAIAIKIFGNTEFAARVITALATLALIAITARTSVLLGVGKRGFVAGLIISSSLGLDIMSRVAMPDMLLTALFAGACFNSLIALQTGSARSFRIAAGLMGAAALVKGPVAPALFGIILLFYYWIHRGQRRNILKLILDPWACLLLMSPLAVWLAIIGFKQPGTAYYFIVNEQILRFLGLRKPDDYYSGSILYYVPRLFLFSFPWIGVLLFGWLVSPKTFNTNKQLVRNFLWICVWVPFVFFSVSSAKANYYILLCMPPLALLTADYLPDLLKERQRFHLTASIVIPVLLLMAIWALKYWAAPREGTQGITRESIYLLIIVFIVVITIIAMGLLQFNFRRAAVLCLGGLIFPLSMGIDRIAIDAGPFVSAKALATYIKKNYPSTQVMLYQDFEAVGSLPFYLDRTIPVIDSKSNDLFYGQHVMPKSTNFLTVKQALKLRTNILAVVMDDRKQAFLTSGLQPFSTELTTIGKTTLYKLSIPSQ